MESTDTQKRRVRRMAQRQGLTAIEKAGKWFLAETLSHREMASDLDLGQAEAWLRNRERMPGGEG